MPCVREAQRQPPPSPSWSPRGLQHTIIHLKGRRPVSAPNVIVAAAAAKSDTLVVPPEASATANASPDGNHSSRRRPAPHPPPLAESFSSSNVHTRLPPARPTSISRPSTAGRSAAAVSSCSDLASYTAACQIGSAMSTPRCVEMVLQPMEASLADLDPQALYLHAHVYQFSRGLLADRTDPDVQRVALAAAQTAAAAGGSSSATPFRAVSSASSRNRPVSSGGGVLTLEDRVRRSEERMVKLRANARTHARGGHTEKNDPRSLQLLVARLCGNGAHAVDDATENEEQMSNGELQPSSHIAGDTGTLGADYEAFLRSWDAAQPREGVAEVALTKKGQSTTRHDSSSTTHTAAAGPHSQHRNSPRGHAAAADDATSAPLSTTEAAVQQRLHDKVELLKAEQVTARTDARRAELADSIRRYERLEQECRSALGHLNLALGSATSPAGGHSRVMSWPALRQRLQLDRLTSEQLDARLVYGDVARHIREEVQYARRAQLKQSLEHEQPLPPEVRHTFAKKRRAQERASTEHLLRERHERWEEHARGARTLGFTERIVECARQEVERRKFLWRALVLVHKYPKELIARRAVVLQRLLMSKKKKDEHVAHFLWLMRRCLTRRRQRISRRLWTSAYVAYRFLRLFYFVSVRRTAVGHIAEWFHEHRRRRPMPVIVHSFLSTIQKCQRMARQLIRRRRLEACWLLALSFRLPDAGQCFLPQRAPKTGLRQRGTAVDTTPKPQAASAAPLSDSAVLRVVLERFLDDGIIPNFDTRLAVAERLVRCRAQAYAEAVRECQKRRKLLRMLQLRGIATLPDGSSTSKLPPWPHHSMLPSMEMLHTFVAECNSALRLWIIRNVTDALSSVPRGVPPESTNGGEPLVRVEELVMARLTATLKQSEEVPFVRRWATWMLTAHFGGEVPVAQQQQHHSARPPPQRGAASFVGSVRRRSGTTRVDRRRDAPRRLSERKPTANNSLDSSMTSQEDCSSRTTLEALEFYQRALKQSLVKAT